MSCMAVVVWPYTLASGGGVLAFIDYTQNKHKTKLLSVIIQYTDTEQRGKRGYSSCRVARTNASKISYLYVATANPRNISWKLLLLLQYLQSLRNEYQIYTYVTHSALFWSFEIAHHFKNKLPACCSQELVLRTRFASNRPIDNARTSMSKTK